MFKSEPPHSRLSVDQTHPLFLLGRWRVVVVVVVVGWGVIKSDRAAQCGQGAGVTPTCKETVR